jgi:predicted porin
MRPATLSVGAGVQQTSDNSSNKQTVFNVDVVYAFSSVKLFAGYFYGKDDTGFVGNSLAQRNLVMGTDIFAGSGRKDSAPFAGINWQASPALALTAAAYYDHMRNAAVGGGELGSGNGTRWLGLRNTRCLKPRRSMAQSTLTT